MQPRPRRPISIHMHANAMAARAQPVTSPPTCIEGEEKRWWMRKRGTLSSTPRLVRRREYTDWLRALSKLTRVYMADARLPKYITTAELAGGWCLSATTNFFDVPPPLTSPPSPPFLLLVALSCRLFRWSYVQFSRNGLTHWTNSRIHSTGETRFHRGDHRMNIR